MHFSIFFSNYKNDSYSIFVCKAELYNIFSNFSDYIYLNLNKIHICLVYRISITTYFSISKKYSHYSDYSITVFYIHIYYISYLHITLLLNVSILGIEMMKILRCWQEYLFSINVIII